MNKQILVLVLLCFVLNGYSSEKKPKEGDIITTEKLAEIINKSFIQNKKQSGVNQVDIYVLLNSGIYHYNLKSKTLDNYMEDNYKAQLGNENMAVGVLYVVHDTSAKKDYSSKYLCCCSIANSILHNLQDDNLTIISREKVDKDQLNTLLKLGRDDKVLISQTFGCR